MQDPKIPQSGNASSEKNILESELKFRSLFESMSEGFALHEMIYDADGKAANYRLADVNPAFERHTGIPIACAFGRVATEVYKTDTAPYLEQYARVVKTGEPYSFETYFPPLDKSFSISAYSPKPGWFATVFTDITERTRAHQAIRESEEKFRDLSELLPALIYEMNLAGEITYVNKSGYALTGYTENDFRDGFSGIDIIVSGDHPRLLRNIQNILAGEDRTTHEYTARTKQGKAFPVLASSVPIIKEGKPAGLRGVFVDITERKEAEQRLYQSEFNLKQAQKVAHLGNWVWHIKTNRLEWSEEMYNIFGIERENFSGDLNEVISKAIHPEDRAAVESSNLSVIRDKKPMPLEYRVVWPDKTIHTVWAEAGKLVLDDEGNPEMLTGIVQDITLRRHAEETLRIVLSITQKSKEESLGLLHAATTVLESESFEKTARQIFEECRKVIGAVSGYVALLSASGEENEVLFLESGGLPCTVNPDLPMPIRGLRAEAYSRATVVYENDFMRSEWVRLMPQGHVRMQNVMFAPLRIDNKVVGVIGLANKPSDFTGDDARIAGAFGDLAAIALGRARAAQKLKESENKYRSLFESSRDALMTLEPPLWRFTSGNPATLDMFGARDEEEFLTYTPGELSPKLQSDGRASVEKAMEMIEMAMSEGSHFFGWIHKRIDGAEFPATVLLTRIEVDGKAFVQATVRDITEDLRAKERIEMLKHSIDVLAEGAYWMDTDNRFVYVNRTGCRVLGYTEGELIGKSLMKINPQATPEALGRVWELLRTEGRYTSRSVHRRKDGSEFPVEIRSSYLKYSGREYNCGFATDITESVRAEEDNLKIEQQLQQTQKLESLGVLAGGIAHDFNNLLGGIFGYIDIVREKISDEKTDRYLSKAMNAIERARGLTQQLLTFAKGGTPIRKVGHLFPFVRETAQFALSGSNVSSTYKIPDNLRPCSFDRNQIGQVIDNMVINAQQAMPGGGAIEVRAENISLREKEHFALAAGDYVKLSIGDTGIGIPKEILSRIFDPFFTTKSKGHGLGLATCFSIVNHHKGWIDVESEPGRGSTFHVYLPAVNENVLLSAEESDTSHAGHGTMVVMDDEVVMRETIGGMLEAFGYTVVCKENGKDVIDFFTAETRARRTLEGMFFDLTIPGSMGGSEAVMGIRKIDRNIPVFVVSGYAEDPVVAFPEQYGFTASICKPFRKAELAKMLNKYLRRPNDHSPPPAPRPSGPSTTSERRPDREG